VHSTSSHLPMPARLWEALAVRETFITHNQQIQ
jgi:hypothetical protein